MRSPGAGTYRLDLDEIGRRLELNLLGESVRLLRGGPVVVVPTGTARGPLEPAALAAGAGHVRWRRRRPRGCERAAPPTRPNIELALVGGPRLVTGDAEVRQLAAQISDAVVLAGGSAVADRVMAAMDGAWLVHIAAHGTFLADSPLFSAIELDDGPLTVYDLERLRRAPYRVVFVELQFGGR